MKVKEDTERKHKEEVVPEKEGNDDAAQTEQMQQNSEVLLGPGVSEDPTEPEQKQNDNEQKETEQSPTKIEPDSRVESEADSEAATYDTRISIYSRNSITEPLIGGSVAVEAGNNSMGCCSLQQIISAVLFCLSFVATVCYIIKTSIDPPGTYPTGLQIFLRILPLVIICWHVPIVLCKHDRFKEALPRACLFFAAFIFHGTGDAFLEVKSGDIYFQIGQQYVCWLYRNIL